MDCGMQEQGTEEQPPTKRAKIGGTGGQAATAGLNEMGESEEEDDDELRPVEASSGEEEDTELLVPKAPKDGLQVAISSSGVWH